VPLGYRAFVNIQSLLKFQGQRGNDDDVNALTHTSSCLRCGAHNCTFIKKSIPAAAPASFNWLDAPSDAHANLLSCAVDGTLNS